jgi:hypothetical protein
MFSMSFLAGARCLAYLLQGRLLAHTETLDGGGSASSASDLLFFIRRGIMVDIFNGISYCRTFPWIMGFIQCADPVAV